MDSMQSYQKRRSYDDRRVRFNIVKALIKSNYKEKCLYAINCWVNTSVFLHKPDFQKCFGSRKADLLQWSYIHLLWEEQRGDIRRSLSSGGRMMTHNPRKPRWWETLYPNGRFQHIADSQMRSDLHVQRWRQLCGRAACVRRLRVRALQDRRAS